uniref:Uncharacterized protein n=1 Tax=Moniliophthora roreri TaxID=221103 RepID=A0A0W0FGN2_MONRR
MYADCLQLWKDFGASYCVRSQVQNHPISAAISAYLLFCQLPDESGAVSG